jgi:Leucine-rich repeat (LRR) protein
MNRLSGELPTQIGNLKHLETLAFNNELEGEIPSSLYQVGTLKTLLLSSNKFYGRLSADISNLKMLENLSLFENQGQVPLI